MERAGNKDMKPLEITTLPTLPTAAVRLLQLYDNVDAQLSDIVGIIRTDPALAGKVLRAANSSFYNTGKEIQDLSRATQFLGRKVITALTLGFSLVEESMKKGPIAKWYLEYWMSSLVQATTAELIARRYMRGQEGEYFVVGLLARVGQLGMLKNCGPEYLSVLEQSNANVGELLRLEYKSLGVDHVELTTKLMQHWCLPNSFLSCVRNQMRPSSYFREMTGNQLRMNGAIAAGFFMSEFFRMPGEAALLNEIKEILKLVFHATDEEILSLQSQVVLRMQEHSELFNLDLSSLGSPLKLVEEALGRLSLIAAVPEEKCPEEVAETLREENGRLREKVEELARESTTDSLTGVSTRKVFLRRLHEAIEQAEMNYGRVGLLFIDIDHFKSINDRYGHLVGDNVLKSVASTLQSAIRANDVVGRYGGEEFVVLLEDSGVAGLRILAERIRSLVESETIVVAGKGLRVTVSIGAALLAEKDRCHDVVQDLIDRADKCMYCAKRQGRNRVCIDESAEQTVGGTIGQKPVNRLAPEGELVGRN